MRLYTADHRRPAPRAPWSITTVASPRLLEYDELEKAVDGFNHAEPVESFSSNTLNYPEMPPDPDSGVEQVRREYHDCKRCHLCAVRNQVCHLKGSPHATIFAVGEGPDRVDDRRGMPFCGPSGRLQDELFKAAGIDPFNEVAWSNLVGCRPSNSRFDADRPPTDVERIACSERLIMLLRSIRPRVVLCLDQQSARMFWAKDALPPANTWHTLEPPGHPEDWVVVGVTRHPAYLLRVGTVNYKELFAARLFLYKLKSLMPGLTKISKWRFGLQYLNTDVVVGGVRVSR